MSRRAPAGRRRDGASCRAGRPLFLFWTAHALAEDLTMAGPQQRRGPPLPAPMSPRQLPPHAATAALVLTAAALWPADLPAQGAAQAAPVTGRVAPAAERPAVPGAPGRGLDCMIQPGQLVQVGSPAPGVIERILVDRGDLVKQGQPVVLLNASVERANLALARERAQQAGELTAADGARELAEREAARADELYRRNFVSGTYRDKQRAEVKVATGRSDEAREKRALATRELELATAQLAQRTLRAPISGVVVERYLALGEYIDQKPVLRIAQIDPLRVDVLVPAIAFGQVQPGLAASVTPELLERRALPARVTTVDRVIDAASNTFRVRLELPNPGGTLPAGLRCKVDLPLPALAAEAPRPAPATPAAPPAPAVPAAAATPAASPAVHAARR